ncbi:hypothetical protein [Citrobacter youngae]|uniref:Uncharacterized protein n=1 Tax=Citrobacter youngae ATCC 29220 TaxID=500640 RepID=D4BAZ5_9ENTR|nr:hypothetical protein [Citrobacter youngae]EFE09356.1 hypothetical protein CIT292_07642 [Citrobacter youngae ATCC 29220]
MHQSGLLGLSLALFLDRAVTLMRHYPWAFSGLLFLILQRQYVAIMYISRYLYWQNKLRKLSQRLGALLAIESSEYGKILKTYFRLSRVMLQKAMAMYAGPIFASLVVLQQAALFKNRVTQAERGLCPRMLCSLALVPGVVGQ